MRAQAGIQVGALHIFSWRLLGPKLKALVASAGPKTTGLEQNEVTCLPCGWPGSLQWHLEPQPRLCSRGTEVPAGFDLSLPDAES